MTDKQLRSLSKMHMLSLLHEQESEVERLVAENNELQERLNDRRLKIEQAGSLADASVVLTGILQAAQDAADMYLENVRLMEPDMKQDIGNVSAVAEDAMSAILKDLQHKESILVGNIDDMVASMYNILDSNMERLTSLYSEFENDLRSTGLSWQVREDASKT